MKRKYEIEKVEFPEELFTDGDLAFRRGAGIMSHVVIATSTNGLYSHVGIIKKINNRCYVIHAVPGESEKKGDIDCVKIEPINIFFSIDRAIKGAVMRVTDNKLIATNAANHALSISSRGTLFDHEYNLNDSTKMYCTELVNFVYKKCGIDISEGRIRNINLPVIQGKYLMPEDLAAYKDIKQIYHFSR
ncbi:YiiX/YebB-like N1pC/P60 family cysteine hydrolase [uncultured Bacteroides sp.]|uniref:YiiX/YebB-like N1pC/P60 family cysteine hydrolase n=1 Tax=uncultured Bacteroides sp. TaxID=162156 RepID=UPI00259553E9|nr:YiiX/YebB-like N1pC/P60 family cysteine hydrolase [uncultured Bacteroides sp.]